VLTAIFQLKNKNIYTRFLSDGGVDSRSEVCLCSWAGGSQLAGGEILEVKQLSSQKFAKVLVLHAGDISMDNYW